MRWLVALLLNKKTVVTGAGVTMTYRPLVLLLLVTAWLVVATMLGDDWEALVAEHSFRPR